MLEHAKLKRKRESSEIEQEHCHPKRQSSMLRDIGIFVMNTKQLHEVTTLKVVTYVHKSIKNMAVYIPR